MTNVEIYRVLRKNLFDGLRQLEESEASLSKALTPPIDARKVRTLIELRVAKERALDRQRILIFNAYGILSPEEQKDVKGPTDESED